MTASLARYTKDLRPLAAVIGYAALVLVLVAIGLGAVTDLMARRAAVAEAQDRLDRLQGRKPATPGEAAGQDDRAGSPFLEGPSLTVAGAVLMQRVAAAAERADGRILSSRVELEAAPFGPDFVAVTAAVELRQPELQNLLYDLEAGQPYLFVRQLAVQPGQDEGSGAGALRVTLTVYGRWQGAS